MITKSYRIMIHDPNNYYTSEYSHELTREVARMIKRMVKKYYPGLKQVWIEQLIYIDGDLDQVVRIR